jgi:hypothetical protein
MKFCHAGDLLGKIPGRSLFRYFGGETTVLISSLIRIISEGCRYDWRSLESVTFSEPSKLVGLEKEIFTHSGLLSVDLPGSIEVIYESCFSMWGELISVTFCANSKLLRIEQKVF